MPVPLLKTISPFRNSSCGKSTDCFLLLFLSMQFVKQNKQNKQSSPFTIDDIWIFLSICHKYTEMKANHNNSFIGLNLSLLFPMVQRYYFYCLKWYQWLFFLWYKCKIKSHSFSVRLNLFYPIIYFNVLILILSVYIYFQWGNLLGFPIFMPVFKWIKMLVLLNFVSNIINNSRNSIKNRFSVSENRFIKVK